MEYVRSIVMNGQPVKGKYVRFIGNEAGEATMSGQSLFAEHQAVLMVPTLGESMSRISVSRPGIEAATEALGKYVRTIGSSRVMEREPGKGRGPKVCPEYR